MTHPLVDDPVERLLTDALRSARTDQRWAVPARPDMTHRVRRAVRRRRRGQVALAVAAAAIVLPGAVLGLAALPGDERSQDEVFAGAPLAPGEPVPGIAPEFAPSSGSDWLLTEEGLERFAASHSVPSSRPNPVQSPGPLTDYSARLLADVEAGLPAGATTERQDALNGDPATAGIHVLLPDGTPVEVEREPLQAPVAYPLYFGGAQRPVPPPAVVAGSDSAVLSVQEVGYGWGPGIPAGARSVTVVRRDGEATRWYAPLSVPLDMVTQWALAAEANGRS
jgi:hypothetical protein